MHTEGIETIHNLRGTVESLLHHHGGGWRRLIAGILRNQSDADDVLQEAISRVLARNLPFSSREQVRVYLGRSICNAALEVYNARKRERRRQISIEEQTLMPAEMANPYACIEEKEQSLIRNRQLGMLPEGLALLTDKQYEALRLTILESHGLSIRDVGMNSGIAYSTLRHRSQQGLRRLRRFLEEQQKA